MKNFRTNAFLAVVFSLGGTMFISSTFADQTYYTGLRKTRQYTYNTNTGRRIATNVVPKQQAISNASQKVELVAPPSELPTINSRNITASLKTFAPTQQRKAVRKRKLIVKRPYKSNKSVTRHKSGKLYSLVRLLNYAPHPRVENILKDRPLLLGQSQYWFTIGYKEDWKVLKNDKGYIKGISFEINVMENNRKIRTLDTPKIALNASTIKKGQVLGIAEVAPYKFTITVDDFTKKKNGISELIYKLDLEG